MLSACLMAAAYPHSSPNYSLVELYRGVSLSRSATRYWSVSDTHLDARAPDDNFGWSGFLDGGPGKTILIEFGDLRRALGSGIRVRAATLKLKLTGGGPVQLRGISEVLVPWGEGPIPSAAPWIPKPDDTTQAPPKHRWAATWRDRRSGPRGVAWQHSGASGASDTKPFPEAKATGIGEAELLIDGLGPAIEREYERPSEFHGIALQFDAAVDFASSQAPKDRPTLSVEFEDAPNPAGGDLAVIRIEQKPEFERFDPAPGPLAEFGGAPVGLPGPPRNASAPRWPEDGQAMTYTAWVKNVGDAPVAGFRTRWVIGERGGTDVESTRTIAPGDSVSVSTALPYKLDKQDHRTDPIGLLVRAGGDRNASNDFLQIHKGALSLAVQVRRADYVRISKETNLRGSRSFEEWLQSQIAALNEVFFALSRFSFARDGVLERVRVQRIAILDEPAPVLPPDLGCDAVVQVGPGDGLAAADVDRPFLRRVCLRLGLAAWPAAAQIEPDVYPGLLGWGDTRNESMVPPQLGIPYEPAFEPMFEAVAFEPTDLLSATDVACLNASVGFRGGYEGDALFQLPGITILRARDMLGQPLGNLKLAFFQMRNGSFALEAPDFELTTTVDGTAILPNRDTGAGPSYATPRGHVLRPNPFGRVATDASNGAFRVRASASGASAWASLKLWQVVDANRRSPIGTIFADLRFNLPGGPIEAAADLAVGRIVTDSANSLPAKLGSLVDGKPQDSVELPNRAGTWLELDLGRDRVIGEIALASRGDPFWKRFEIVVYGTSQTPAEGARWAVETDWGWTAANRSRSDSSGFASVSYFSRPRRARYVRITCKAEGAGAHLAGLTVRPLSLPAPP